MKHLHFLGICGTFMGSLALIAKQLGYRVTGSDENIYPPMSTQLQEQGIDLVPGYGVDQLALKPDLYIIGNAMKRGLPVVEAILDLQLPYTSGPEWLSHAVLRHKWVLAIAGTHGKTTTSSILAWILEYAGLNPAFLIGGVPQNFGVSARMTDSPYFVIEADEHDTAFFDKRSKFVHYHPKTLVMNNLEYDHADIFDSVQDIQKQFHHVIRIVPHSGQLIYNKNAPYLVETLEKGSYSQKISFGEGADLSAKALKPDGTHFEVFDRNHSLGEAHWDLLGTHNIENALSAIAASLQVGVKPHVALKALSSFKNVKRRLELKGVVRGISVFDDFAHHPTAIEVTLKGLRAHQTQGHLIAILEPRSNTMRMNVHGTALRDSLEVADEIYLFQPAGIQSKLDEMMVGCSKPYFIFNTTADLIEALKQKAQPDDHLVIMSNGGFEGIHERLLKVL